MHTNNIEISSLIEFIRQRIQSIFKDNLLGLYLFGSLSYGDFLPGRSDIDLLAVTQNKTNDSEIAKISKLYNEIGQKYPKWKGRVECSFTPEYMLKEVLPPKEPRPYFGEKFYKKATYGSEWLINNYLLQQYGITLYGPDFNELTNPIRVEDVQEACVRDLIQEWKTKLNEPDFFENPHNQTYFILNLCRILYIVLQADASSKKVAADWVMTNYPEWKVLIQEVRDWVYGETMDRKDEAIRFLQFALSEVENSRRING